MNEPAETQTQAQVPAIRPANDNTAPMLSAFSNINSFVDAQRMAQLLCSSSLVPEDYRGQDKIGNALIALEISQRIGASPLAVMQNMHVIQGRPSWSSQFIIAAINASGKFSPLRFQVEDLGEKEIPYEYWDGPKGQRQKRQGKANVRDTRCLAWAVERSTGERLDGPAVSMEMAVLEGWYTKNDSKWKTMPELMLRYRAAAFFGRLYAPELTMGIPMADEVQDITQPKAAPSVMLATPADTIHEAEIVDGPHDAPAAGNMMQMQDGGPAAPAPRRGRPAKAAPEQQPQEQAAPAPSNDNAPAQEQAEQAQGTEQPAAKETAKEPEQPENSQPAAPLAKPGNDLF